VLISPVTHSSAPTTPRLKSISMDYEILLAELNVVFRKVEEVYTAYFEDWGEVRTFVLRV
jgi:hypothetical protein